MSLGAIPECEHQQDWVAEGLGFEPSHGDIWETGRAIVPLSLLS